MQSPIFNNCHLSLAKTEAELIEATRCCQGSENKTKSFSGVAQIRGFFPPFPSPPPSPPSPPTTFLEKKRTHVPHFSFPSSFPLFPPPGNRRGRRRGRRRRRRRRSQASDKLIFLSLRRHTQVRRYTCIGGGKGVEPISHTHTHCTNRPVLLHARVNFHAPAAWKFTKQKRGFPSHFVPNFDTHFYLPLLFGFFDFVRTIFLFRCLVMSGSIFSCSAADFLFLPRECVYVRLA